MITLITDYFTRAKSRLLSQYQGAAVYEGIIQSIAGSFQEAESVIFDLKDNRSIYNATGVQLDRFGSLLNKPRNGITDDTEYRSVLLAKAAQNVSKGTPEDVIVVFLLLMQARYVEYVEIYPAKFYMTAVGATPIGSGDTIKAAVNATRAAGSSGDTFSSTPGDPFVFDGDPDPQGAGFGTTDDATVGGYFSTIF
jgi:hypothetical protein